MSMNKAVGSADPVRADASPASPSANQEVAVGSQKIALSGREVLAGAISGVAAGFTMGLVAVVVSLTHGFGLWAPFNDVAGAIFPGVISQTGPINVQTVVAGIFIHFTISVVLGMLFTTLYSGLFKLTFDYGTPLMIGLAFSWIIWMMVRFVFLPLLASGVYEVPAFIIAHGVYGVTLGLVYPIVRRQLAARRILARA
ncbi:MAG: hypothetical protein H7Y32_02380 [Chloroflexales bacterium]|nr:hypothetical protein [Chloroflexales bacterium]